MLTLYGNLDSGNDYKVRLLLAQLGIPFRRVDTLQSRGEPNSAAFRAINPIGKIPTIAFDDGRMLSESGAILFYFARGTALFPSDAWEQANVLRWMFFEQYSHEPYIAVNRHWRLHYPAAELARLADRLAANHGRGEQALYAYTHTAADGGFDLAPYAGIGRWLARVRAQPGHVRQFDEVGAVPAVPWPG
jgi:glutathione S-transferase